MPGWWRRRSLRARLTVVTTAGLAVALLGGALLLVGALHASLVRSLDSTARQEAIQVATLQNRNLLPSLVPVATGTVSVQVVSPGGTIVKASPTADRLVPLLPVAKAAVNARTGRAALLDGRPYGYPYPLWVVAVPAKGRQTVLAAVDFQQVAGSVAALARALLVGTPLLLLLLAWVTWVVTGSTLRPIAALRRGAQVVTATAQPRALPVPEARDEVHSLAVTLNDMLARLDAAQRRQRGLISDTAHELRSPIASIRAQLEVALDHPDQQDWRETASGVLADTLRLARLAEDLLLLARLDERGGRAAAGAPVDLAALAEQEAARAAGGPAPGSALRTAAPGSALRTAAPGSHPPHGRVPVRVETDGPGIVTGDAEALRRLLRNLLENAMRYAKSRVDVTVRREGDEVVLCVSDDGPGVPEPDAERAFGRFVRLDEARSREDDGTGGAGLGLAIVRATAQAHGGRAWLEPAGGDPPWPGLRAMVALPAAATTVPTAAATRPPPERTAVSGTRSTGGTGASEPG